MYWIKTPDLVLVSLLLILKTFNTILTYFMPLFSFYTHWKTSGNLLLSDVFWGYRKRPVAWKRLSILVFYLLLKFWTGIPLLGKKYGNYQTEYEKSYTWNFYLEHIFSRDFDAAMTRLKWSMWYTKRKFSRVNSKFLSSFVFIYGVNLKVSINI